MVKKKSPESLKELLKQLGCDDMDAFLREARVVSVGVADGEEVHTMPEDIVVKLFKMWDACYSGRNNHEFVGGQPVRFKLPEFMSFKTPKQPMLFVRYLDDIIYGYDRSDNAGELFGSMASGMQVDCIVLTWHGNTADPHVMDSRLLEPWSPAVNKLSS